MLRRIILPDTVHAETTVSLEGELFLALRMREPYQGEIITVQDATGKAFRGRIIELKEDQARVLLFEEMTGPAESPFDLFLFQALPEKERMELIIQKATELGVS
ncbi:MAG: 16S rRNA (uracil(1498)-N(3))-methyltransferase, partial [Deltaproteobacteria bacterium]|nr:16S rRNA (uracil(1498)-N(3))-methyltransferase [Deltaproteobacteria bacterium]